ncbi:methionine ABC transporter ATP-binding protein [Lacticigenium naphthae]|uniref:methionine ABC transporter ATP-binding protein n=1 Tax=Lacticigenium naphthae TaxID=515351 RepID=UPI000421C0F0|nr:ATP-binding cassette domain-containing protein [Lacticigenium naphthae]
MITLDQVSKSFQNNSGEFKAIDAVTFTIQDHERFGIIGESGAGKSTLLRFINALETPDEGAVMVDGKNIHQLNKSALRLYQKQVAMIFQEFNLLNNKTVEENIRLPLELHAYPETIPMETVLDFVGLRDKRGQYPKDLSGGQKQRVGIARALITRPKILLCDEPTSALDLGTTKEIVDVLKKAHDTFGMTIVLVTHELEVIKELCTRAAILENGMLTDVIKIEPPKNKKSYSSYRKRALEVLSHGSD